MDTNSYTIRYDLQNQVLQYALGLSYVDIITSAIGSPLPDGEFLIGNSSGVATARPITGDITITDMGVATVTNSDNLTAKTITGDGSPVGLIIKPSVDSVTALEITNAAGSGVPVLTVDVIDPTLRFNTNSFFVAPGINVGGSIAATGTVSGENVTVGEGVLLLEAGYTQAQIVMETPTRGQLQVAVDTGNLLYSNGTGWFTVDLTAA